MPKLIFLLLIIPILSASAQDLRKKRPLISAVEVFAGPNVSFNHGNKFIENYEDENVTNTQLLKIGYAAGVGVFHPVTTRIDLNVRLQYETKGTRNELDVPRGNDESRVIITSEYTYHYITASVIPQISLGKRIKIGVGGYYSKVKKIKGYDQESFTRKDRKDSEINFEGRIFRDLKDDGGVQGFAISRGLFRMEKNDYGPVLMISYTAFIKEQSFSFQLINYHGLRNINRNNPYGLEERNRTLYLIITYQLPINKYV